MPHTQANLEAVRYSQKEGRVVRSPILMWVEVMEDVNETYWLAMIFEVEEGALQRLVDIDANPYFESSYEHWHLHDTDGEVVFVCGEWIPLGEFEEVCRRGHEEEEAAEAHNARLTEAI
jgi:hypothetical protein